jgi:hypothetical protein
MSHESKLEAAKQYLRDRKIYVTEFPFKPTTAAATDVWVTVAKYKFNVLNKSKPLMQVKVK